jgi:hypothetical protein
MRLKNLTPPQIDYYNDKHRFLVVSAGRRGRKTLIGARRVLRKAIRNEDHKYFLGAPTHMQSKNIYWKRLMEDTKLLRKDISRSELVITLVNNTEIAVIGLDRPERIEGQEWHGCHITEFGNVKANAWDEHIRPALADTRGFAVLDGVPEGRNHYYDRALYACDEVIPSTVPLRGAFHDCKHDDEWAFYTWFSADVLKPSEIEHARQQLDARTYRQEYEGSFESYAGVAYYTFGEHNFANVQRDWASPISVGMDFNVNPMTATLGTIKGDSYHQWGEIWLENSNTYEMRDELLKYVDDPREIIIFPDSTGKAEKSNATESDLAILRKAKFTVKAHPSNPYVIDRVNAVNSIMVDRGKKTRYLINPKSCPKTINDWNRVIRKDDGSLDKEQEKQMIGHISAGAGYLIAFNWPVKESSIDYTKRY